MRCWRRLDRRGHGRWLGGEWGGRRGSATRAKDGREAPRFLRCGRCGSRGRSWRGRRGGCRGGAGWHRRPGGGLRDLGDGWHGGHRWCRWRRWRLGRSARQVGRAQDDRRGVRKCGGRRWLLRRWLLRRWLLRRWRFGGRRRLHGELERDPDTRRRRRGWRSGGYRRRRWRWDLRRRCRLRRRRGRRGRGGELERWSGGRGRRREETGELSRAIGGFDTSRRAGGGSAGRALVIEGVQPPRQRLTLGEPWRDDDWCSVHHPHFYIFLPALIDQAARARDQAVARGRIHAVQPMYRHRALAGALESLHDTPFWSVVGCGEIVSGV